MRCHSMAKWPVSNISTLSPGDKLFTNDASQAPVPDDGKITTSPAVWKIDLSPSRMDSVSCGEFRPAVIDGRRIHRAQHAVGNVGRTGDLEKMASALNSHQSSLWYFTRQAGFQRMPIGNLIIGKYSLSEL